MDAVESIEKTVGWLLQTNAYPDLLYVEKNSSNVEKPLSETPIFEVGVMPLGDYSGFTKNLSQSCKVHFLKGQVSEHMIVLVSWTLPFG